VTRAELIAELEELAAMVAGWSPIVPPAVATGRVAVRLRALARDVEAGGIETGPSPPESPPTESRIPWA
jgi:hypothetical protein